jgi:hypothetical protein
MRQIPRLRTTRLSSRDRIFRASPSETLLGLAASALRSSSLPSDSSARGRGQTCVATPHQASLPTSPLNGPVNSGVIQPP